MKHPHVFVSIPWWVYLIGVTIGVAIVVTIVVPLIIVFVIIAVLWGGFLLVRRLTHTPTAEEIHLEQEKEARKLYVTWLHNVAKGQHHDPYEMFRRLDLILDTWDELGMQSRPADLEDIRQMYRGWGYHIQSRHQYLAEKRANVGSSPAAGTTI